MSILISSRAVTAPVIVRPKITRTTLTEETKRNLWNLDCIPGARHHLPDETVDLEVHDPPWGIGEGSFNRYFGDNPALTIPGYVEAPADYLGWTRHWMAEARRVLKPNGCMYVVSGYDNDYKIRIAAEELGLHLISLITWYRAGWRPTGRKFASAGYPIFLFAKSRKARYTFNRDCRFTKEQKDERGRSLRYYDLSNVWSIPTEHHRVGLKNGNKLPSELIRKMIQYSSNEGDLVCDFFLGNFTTAYVAQKLNRRVTGFEKNPNAFRYHVEGVVPNLDEADGALEGHVPNRRGNTGPSGLNHVRLPNIEGGHT